MKPPPFAYLRPVEIDAAVDALATYGDEAKPLAGGQSLLPMMNFRLARPAILIDLERIPGLDRIHAEDETLEVGAMARQAEVGRSAEVRRHVPLVGDALRHVGHHQIRTRGTIGGSLAHADPAAELPAVALLLDAEMRARGPDGQRVIAAERFFEGPFTTALADDELLVSVRFPLGTADASAFEEISRRSGDFAIVGVVGSRVADQVRLVGFGLGWVPLRLRAAEGVLSGAALSEATIATAAEAAQAEAEPMSDVHADADYRRDALGTLVRRVVERLRP